MALPTVKATNLKDGYVVVDPTKPASCKNMALGKIGRATASDIYQNVQPGISIRDEFGYQDYEEWRPGEKIPSKPKEIIKFCNKAYYKVALVQNVVNLMADFTVKGISLVHENKNAEKLYQQWFASSNGPIVSERIANYLYRVANTVIQRKYATLEPDAIQRLKKGKLVKDDVQLKRSGKIPFGYSFLNLDTIEVMNGEEEALYTGKIKLGVKLDKKLQRALKNDNALPSDLNRGVQPLDMNKIIMLHYKKDDWMFWAPPMIYSILESIIMVDKLRLADLSALDGAISHIRVWKLGNMEAKLWPREGSINYLSNILMNNIGSGSMDLVWGPDIELIETNTEVYKFLGFEKYVPHMNAIYEGLGIPPSLTGSQSASGFTNNMVSLKTMIERLHYVRSIIVGFWKNEIELFRTEMGLRSPAHVVFDTLNLSDESTERKLLIDLLDRGVVSYEAVQREFGRVPEIEAMRMKREAAMREAGVLEPKAGPFTNDANQENDLEKIKVQKKLDKEIQQSKPKGKPGEGRPLNSKDTKKRKQKKVTPVGASYDQKVTWAKKAYAKISHIIDGVDTKFTGEALDHFKFLVLANTEPLSNVTVKSVLNTIRAELKIHPEIDKAYLEVYKHKEDKADLAAVMYLAGV